MSRIAIHYDVSWDDSDLIAVCYYGPTRPQAGAASVVSSVAWANRGFRAILIRELRRREQQFRRENKATERTE